MWRVKLTSFLTACCVGQGSLWGQGASDPGLRGHPGHPIRPLRQCQQQLGHLAAHLHHPPPSAARPASELPGSDRHLRHCHQQRGDAATYLLQSGQEPQLWHGKTRFYLLSEHFCIITYICTFYTTVFFPFSGAPTCSCVTRNQYLRPIPSFTKLVSKDLMVSNVLQW